MPSKCEQHQKWSTQTDYIWAKTYQIDFSVNQIKAWKIDFDINLILIQVYNWFLSLTSQPCCSDENENRRILPEIHLKTIESRSIDYNRKSTHRNWTVLKWMLDAITGKVIFVNRMEMKTLPQIMLQKRKIWWNVFFFLPSNESANEAANFPMVVSLFINKYRQTDCNIKIRICFFLLFFGKTIYVQIDRNKMSKNEFALLMRLIDLSLVDFQTRERISLFLALRSFHACSHCNHFWMRARARSCNFMIEFSSLWP